MSSAAGLAPAALGRALFEVHCATCHGPGGGGGFIARDMRPPAIAGKEVHEIVRQIRHGGVEMPVFSPAVLSDEAVSAIATHVHATLAHPEDRPARIGPRDLDPFLVGLFTWGALVAFACVLAVLFAEGRN